MKNILLYLQRTPVKALLLATTLLTLSQFAQAQTTTWVGAGADQFWATPANWTTSGGSIPPAPTDNVIFPNGTFPVSVDGYDNIVGSSTAIGSLSYLNTAGTRTTHINDGQTLTVNGTFTEGVATFTTVVVMSGNGNFAVNNVAGNFNVGGNGGSTETVTLTLPDGTNTLNLKTFSLGESASANGRQCILNLGAGPTIINADTLNLGTGKASGTVQWLDPTFTNRITIRTHTGTGRATLLLGNGSSGSGSSNGKLLLLGHPADILASTTTLGGNSGSDTGTGNAGTLSYDIGTFDVTTLLMAKSTSTGNKGASAGTLNVGGNPTNAAVLTVNSPTGPGGGTFVISDASSANPGTGTFNLNTNGTAQIYTSITKFNVASNTATINITGGTLNMEAATNTIGTRLIPIDNVTLDFATLNLAQDGSTPNISVINLFLNDTNVVNFSALPPIIHLPTSIPIISYTGLGSALNLGVGTLPGDYQGQIVDDGAGTISLMVTSGTIVVARQDTWIGGVNNNWDVSTLNWTNAGLSVTNYSEADFVTFDDKGTTGNVTLLGTQHTPSGMTVANNALNYVLSGAGKISGSTSLVKSGTGSLTLAESGGDNFSGGIFVHGGTLILDQPTSALPGGLTNDPGSAVQIGNNDSNGTLPNGNVEIDGSLVFAQTNNHTISTVISGSGSVTQNGSNTLTLNTAETYTGNTIVSTGTLTLGNVGSVASPLIAVQNATLNINPANTISLSAVSLTNGTLNVGAGTNFPAITTLKLTNSTINFIADYNNPITLLSVGALSTGGASNILNVSAIRNLPLSPAMPFHLPLIGYSSFSGAFNFSWTNLPGISGYITNNTTSSTIDLVITNAPQNLTWNGGSATGNNWSDTANWSGTPIAALDALTFDGLLRTNNVNDTPAGTTYASITFNNSAGDAPFTISGAPVNITGTILNNSADVQTVNLGLNVNAGVTLDGGTVGGSLAMRGGITNFSTGGQTVTLLDIGTMADLWATNSTTNGGGQLNLQLGSAGGDWTIVDGTGNGTQVQAGNLQLSVNAGTGGGTLEFGSSNSAPNVDAGYPSNGVVNVGGTSGTFAMNNGTLKVGSITVGAGVQGNLNVNGGTMILGSGGFSAGGGAGASVFTGIITNGALYDTNGGQFVLAQRGSGTLTISNGLLQCGTLNLSTGTTTPGAGLINLSGGRLILTNISVGSVSANGWGTVDFNGGTLQPATNTAALFKQTNLLPLTNNVQAGGAIIDTAGFDATFNWPLNTDPDLALGGLPDGGLTKLGAGTLTLTSPNTYVGNTAVGGGTLIINGVQPASAVTVSNGATLGGNGVVSNVTVNAGGTLSPGNNAIGILTVGGDVSLAGTTTMEINKTLGTNDLLRATNSTPSTITYGGTLNVPVVAGTLVAGDTFKFFSASNYVGSFTAINPPNVTWNTSSLNVNGTLTVASVTPPGPTTNANITKVTLSGTNLLVHGTNNNVPNNMLHYVVLTSTNITKPLSNWTPVVTNTYNGDGTFDFSSPIVPGAPQQFIDVKAVQ